MTETIPSMSVNSRRGNFGMTNGPIITRKVTFGTYANLYERAQPGSMVEGNLSFQVYIYFYERGTWFEFHSIHYKIAIFFINS